MANNHAIRKIVLVTGASYKNIKPSTNPQIITNLIIRAVRARKPKTRYVAGLYAKPMMFVRKWFGDRAYDKIVLSMFSSD